MRKLASVVRFLVGAATVLAAPVASAAYVDFRTANVTGTQNTWTTTVDGVTVTVTAVPSSGSLYWDSTDGFGVNSSAGYDADEIESGERLVVTFSDPVEVSSVLLTDLFKEYKNTGTGTYLEGGSLVLSNGQQVWFTADSSQLINATSGQKLVNVDALTTSIVFKAPGIVGATDNEFAVARIDFEKPTSVPEMDPHSAAGGLALLACGLLIALGRRRPDGNPGVEA